MQWLLIIGSKDLASSDFLICLGTNLVGVGSWEAGFFIGWAILYVVVGRNN